MTGPESLRLKALITKHVANEAARTDLTNLVARCVDAESARDDLRSTLLDLGGTAKMAVSRAEDSYPPWGLDDAR